MIWMRTWALAAAAPLALLLLAAACGSGDDAAPTPSGPALSDEQYLKVVCTGLTNFSDALLTRTKAEDIAGVIQEYIRQLQAVNPPGDLQKFHADFVKYLQDSVKDPTSLITRKPPMPADDIRRRVAAKERNVPECKNPTFFAIPSPTP